jgi:hypothetical protein
LAAASKTVSPSRSSGFANARAANTSFELWCFELAFCFLSRGAEVATEISAAGVANPSVVSVPGVFAMTLLGVEKTSK